MDLFEIAETQHCRREEAAARLHALGTPWPSNTVEVEGDGRRLTVSVPDEVDLKFEAELGDVNEQRAASDDIGRARPHTSTSISSLYIDLVPPDAD